MKEKRGYKKQAMEDEREKRKQEASYGG